MQILAVGRMRDRAQLTLCERYLQRIRPTPHLIEINTQAKGDKAKIKAREGEEILTRITPKAFVIALDERGDCYTSEQFSRHLRKWCERKVIFVIGGANGLSQGVLARADSVLSLSSLTWPHMLVRIMLAEQLYRAQTILLGHPYHKQG